MSLTAANLGVVGDLFRTQGWADAEGDGGVELRPNGGVEVLHERRVHGHKRCREKGRERVGNSRSKPL